jgi:protocatechuate 3,4-dioxygenase beta subunit
VVRSTRGCTPLAQARIEIWQVNEQAEYADSHRATLFSAADGTYRFESNFPNPYSGRPSHIHLRASAAGHQTLITQYYPVAGQTAAAFDLVLIPTSP